VLALSAVVPAALACARPAAPSAAAAASGVTPDDLLAAYRAHAAGERVIDPEGYIAFLRATRFRHGELDSLPRCAILLHDARPELFLARSRLAPVRPDTLTLGTNDPTTLYVVRRGAAGPGVIVTGGLPGAGGASSQVAELAALGVRHLVHVGTAGLLGPAVEWGALVVSDGSYKDGAAILLSGAATAGDPLARPDPALSAALRAALAAASRAAASRAPARGVGFTMPVMYYQPAGLVRWVLESPAFAATGRASFVEMEQGSVFETARRTGVRAASIVFGSDRYTVRDGRLVHEFHDLAADSLKLGAVDAALAAFERTPGC
jgi:uridine phosphorylase